VPGSDRKHLRFDRPTEYEALERRESPWLRRTLAAIKRISIAARRVGEINRGQSSGLCEALQHSTPACTVARPALREDMGTSRRWKRAAAGPSQGDWGGRPSPKAPGSNVARSRSEWRRMEVGRKSLMPQTVWRQYPFRRAVGLQGCSLIAMFTRAVISCWHASLCLCSFRHHHSLSPPQSLDTFVSCHFDLHIFIFILLDLLRFQAS
jgi:hypothetical protein